MINKKIKIVCVLLGLLFFVGIAKILLLQKDLELAQAQLVTAEESYPEIYNVIDSVTITNFADRIANKESFTVYVGRPTCGDCTAFEPKLIQMIQDNDLQQELIYLNVNEVRKDEREWENFKKDYEVEYTPTIAKFQDGKLVAKVNWTPENGTNLSEFDLFLKEL